MTAADLRAYANHWRAIAESAKSAHQGMASIERPGHELAAASSLIVQALQLAVKLDEAAARLERR